MEQRIHRNHYRVKFSVIPVKYTQLIHCYLLPGPIMDLAFRYLPRYANERSSPVDKLWFMVLLGGFAHATKPVGQLTVNLLTGWPIGSFRFGVVYPFASHLLFGMIGGLLGALIVFGIRHLSPKTEK